MFAIAIPFLFTGFWNIYAAIDDKRMNVPDETFTFHSAGRFGIGAAYSRRIAYPVFMIMFGTIVLAITAAFLSANRSTEDFGAVTLSSEFFYGVIVTVYFLRRLNKKPPYPPFVKRGQVQQLEDGTGAAVFFASVATFGLFYVFYYFYKKGINKNGDG